MNNRKNAKLELFEIYGDGDTDGNQNERDGEIGDGVVKRKQLSLMQSVKIQTVPLFQSPYLFRTVLICAIQFTVFFTCQGLNVFFTEISNRLAVNSNHTERMMMCDILNLSKSHVIDDHAGKIEEVG